MYLLALAADYDGTLAQNGIIAPETFHSLRLLKESGRRLLMVTGRELPDIRRLCPDLSPFDRVVAENGALLYDPAADRTEPLAPPPPPAFIEALKARGVAPLSVGEAIVATWTPHQTAALDAIREFQLELQIVFNKGAVMILPTGVNKATGLLAALQDLDISPHNVVGVGDAENDHAFLRACGCSAAVANALPRLKAEVDLVFDSDHGAGVSELIGRLIELDSRIGRKAEHGLPVGYGQYEKPIYLDPFGGSFLVTGRPRCGKSTFGTALTEQMVKKAFEFCVIDPEGDYVGLEDCIAIGGTKAAPRLGDVLRLLHDADVNLVLHTQSLRMKERAELFSALIVQSAHLRARTGRPHWLLIDEAHQVLPSEHAGTWCHLEGDIPAAILITAFPPSLPHEVLETVSSVLILGEKPAEVLATVSQALRLPVPGDIPQTRNGEALLWSVATGRVEAMRPVTPAQTHRRHAGKYAAGDVGAERSFYFRGPHRHLNIGANNLYRFLDVASGVDDATWEHHLRAGDYSAWFRNVINDEELAADTATVERDMSLHASDSRRRVRQAIWRRYAAPGASLDN